MGPSWAVLGASWAVLVPSRAVLGLAAGIDRDTPLGGQRYTATTVPYPANDGELSGKRRELSGKRRELSGKRRELSGKRR